MNTNTLLGTERNAPPHFAGRDAELAQLAAYAEDVFRNADPSGGIALIDGVPGSGKTQLMREFIERERTKRKGLLVLAVTTADLPVDPKSLMFLIASAMPVAARDLIGEPSDQRFLMAALAHGAELRSRYYEARLSAMRAPKGIVYLLAGAMDDGGREKPMYLHEVVQALEGIPAAHNPAGLSPMAVLDSAVEAGVLIEEQGRYSFGIPSFHQHALESCRAMVGSAD